MKFIKSIKDIFNKGKQEIKAVLSEREDIILKYKDKKNIIDGITIILNVVESQGEQVYRWRLSIAYNDSNIKFVDIVSLSDDEIINIPKYIESAIELKIKATDLSKRVNNIIDDSFLAYIEDELGCSDIDIIKWYGYLKDDNREISPISIYYKNSIVACKLSINEYGRSIIPNNLPILTELINHKLEFINDLDITINNEIKARNKILMPRPNIQIDNFRKIIVKHANIIIKEKV